MGYQVSTDDVRMWTGEIIIGDEPSEAVAKRFCQIITAILNARDANTRDMLAEAAMREAFSKSKSHREAFSEFVGMEKIKAGSQPPDTLIEVGSEQ